MKIPRNILFILLVLFLLSNLTASIPAAASGIPLRVDMTNRLLVGETARIQTGPLNKNINDVTCEVRDEVVTFMGKTGNSPTGYTFIFRAARPGNAIIVEKIFRLGKGEEKVASRTFRTRVFAPDEVPAVSSAAIARAPRRYAGRLVKLSGISRGWGRPQKAKKVWGVMATRSDWILEDNTGAVYISGLLRPEKGRHVSVICQVMARPNGAWSLMGRKMDTEAPLQADVKTLIQDNNRFALDFYRRLSPSGGNIFFSPFSISDVLAMTYAGARGETKKQMASVLHFTLPQAKLHPAFSTMIGSLQDGSVGRGYRLRIANALWGQKGFGFLKEFKTLINKNYGGGFYEVDFVKQTEKVREKINRYIEEKTGDKIKNLIARGDINSLTRLVLTNAIYFKGKWASQFKKKNTRSMPFHVTARKTLQVPMMSQEMSLPYFENETFKVLELPYEGDTLFMAILLPRRGIDLDKTEKTLTEEVLRHALSRARKRKVEVFIPKFTLKTKYYLKKTFSAMGMPIAFSNKADFSGMTGKKDLAISKVIHQAFMEVNEEGTEAAAATAVVMRLKAVMRHTVFRADHPFIFFIIHKKTGAILFTGRVVNPK